jgi:hypothetical protein
MMAALLHAVAITPASLSWLLVAARKSHAITLAKLRRWRYSSHVTEKEVTEFDSSNTYGEQAALRLFLCSCTPSRAFNGGLGGGAARLAGCRMYRSVNPAQFRHPYLSIRGGLTAIHGGHHA